MRFTVMTNRRRPFAVAVFVSLVNLEHISQSVPLLPLWLEQMSHASMNKRWVSVTEVPQGTSSPSPPLESLLPPPPTANTVCFSADRCILALNCLVRVAATAADNVFCIILSLLSVITVHIFGLRCQKVHIASAQTHQYFLFTMPAFLLYSVSMCSRSCCSKSRRFGAIRISANWFIIHLNLYRSMFCMAHSCPIDPSYV